MNTNTTLRLAPSLVVQTLLQRKWPITSLTAVSSSPTLHCRLQGSLLFLNPLLAALLQGNIYPFPRCVPFSAALEIDPTYGICVLPGFRMRKVRVRSRNLYLKHSWQFCCRISSVSWIKKNKFRCANSVSPGPHFDKHSHMVLKSWSFKKYCFRDIFGWETYDPCSEGT